MKFPHRAAALPIVVLLITLGLLALFGCARDNNGPSVSVPSSEPPATALPILTTAPSVTPVRATAMPPATVTPRPTPCQHSLQPDLIAAWNEEELGCPITPGLNAVGTAYAPFEGGQMLWRGDTDAIYVLYNDGTWESYPNEWREGDPEYTCGEESSPPTPVRGFGRVWCDYTGVREALGAVTAAEIGDESSVVQDFVNGTVLIAPFGDPFVFVGEDGVWRRVEGQE